MKAFIFTTDALLAVLVAFLVVALTLTYLAQPVVPRSVALAQILGDAAHVAEREGALDSLADGDDGALRAIFRDAPSSACLQVRLLDSTGNQTVVTDASCDTYTHELQTLWLPYHYNGQNYLVRWEGWYR